MVDETIAPPKDFHHYSLGVRIFVSVYLSIILTAGIVGNGLVCAIFVTKRRLRTSINMIVFSLAIADILQSFNMIFMVICVNKGKWVLGYTFSQVNGFITIAFVVTSLLHLFLISLNRYIMICLTKCRHLLSKKIALVGIALAWGYPALLAIAPVLGWAKYEYRPGKLICTIRFNNDLSYTIILIASALLIPLVGLVYCYTKIMKVIIRNRRRIAKLDTAVGGDRRKEEIRIAVVLGVVVVSFIIFYAPAGVANLWEMTVDKSHVMPIYFDLTSVLLAMLNHANNPFIYGFMNKQFRETLMNWFGMSRDMGSNKGKKRKSQSPQEPPLKLRVEENLMHTQTAKTDSCLPKSITQNERAKRISIPTQQSAGIFVARDACIGALV